MWTCRLIPAAGVDEALRVILAAPGARRLASHAQLRAFREYLATSQARGEVLEALEGAQRRAVLLALTLPGGAAVLMIPNPGQHRVCPDALRALIDWWRQRFPPDAFYYEQCLIEPDARDKATLLEHAGFRRVTRLLYLERATAFPWTPPPDDDAVRFVSVASAGEAALADVLRASYADSLDCPELTDKRPPSAVIASHKATGAFDPTLWELALLDDRPVGCVLLSPVSPQGVIEVVYMGVAASARRRGVGRLLLRRAVALSRERRMQRLTLVVDERNAPARALYARFDFQPVAQRDALLRWPARRAESVDNV